MNSKENSLDTKEKLIIELTKIINKKFTDKDFIKELNNEFLKKGFNAKTVNLLLNQEKSVGELNDYQLIALCRVCRKNEKDYFGESIVKSYDSYIGEKKEYDSIIFRNMIKVSDEEYIGIITYEEIFNAMTRNQLYYNLNFQRNPKVVKIGKTYVQIPNIDTKATARIEETALKGKLESSMGVLGIILNDGEEGKYIEEKKGGVYDLTVMEKPAILDFAHRLVGITNAVLKNLSENDTYLKGHMILKFVVASPERCRDIVYQSFLKSQTDINYLKSIDNNDYNIFLEKVIDNSKYLKNKVGNTFEDTKINSNTITYKPILIDVVKQMELDFSTRKAKMFKSKEIAENIDVIYELLIESDKYKNIPNLWVSILNQAYLLCSKKNNYDNILMEYVEKLINITNEDIKVLKLNNKNFNIGSVIKKFEVK